MVLTQSESDTVETLRQLVRLIAVDPASVSFAVEETADNVWLFVSTARENYGPLVGAKASTVMGLQWLALKLNSDRPVRLSIEKPDGFPEFGLHSARANRADAMPRDELLALISSLLDRVVPGCPHSESRHGTMLLVSIGGMDHNEMHNIGAICRALAWTHKAPCCVERAAG